MPLLRIIPGEMAASDEPRLLSPVAPADHELTVVVPAFNEGRRLPRSLGKLREFLDDWQVDYRVIVVDDGSQDDTGTCTDACGDRFSTIRVRRQRGKGAAVRAGMLDGTGRVIAFTDADLPYTLDALRRGYEAVQAGKCDVAFGSRDVEDAEIRVKRWLVRVLASRVFRQLVRRVVPCPITDTQCGLKIFRREAALEIFSRSTIDGFAFDVEVVFLAQRLDMTIARIAVTLVNEDSSTVSMSRDTIPMIWDVFRVGWHAWNSCYDKPAVRLVRFTPAVASTAVRPQRRKVVA